MRHPAGLQPEGQLLVQGGVNCRNAGSGDLHVLSDELVLEVLGLGNLQVLTDELVLEVLGYLTAEELGKLACTSKAAYCFCDHEDLWKACVLEVYGGAFTWKLTWRDSYIASKLASSHQRDTASLDPEQTSSIWSAKDGSNGPAGSCSNGRAKSGRAQKKRKQAAQPGQPSPSLGLIKRAVQVQNFYSDLLYQPWHCATVELDPSWLEVDNIDRRSDLTAEQFYQQYELSNTPVVLTGACKHWAALSNWTIPYLKKAYGHRPVIAGNFKLPFDTYVSYAANTADEMPLYLFDKEFAHPDSGLSQDFSVPHVFRDDLFSVLGADRPDYRWLIAGPSRSGSSLPYVWLIAGPSRSGSSWHIDPNATSAWNAIICGAKKWLLYPPGVIPPGVHPSVDGADVATPVSLIEWFLNFYDATKEGKVRPLECVVHPGDVMFVPRGWWHACLNLETWTIAVTQNFVSRANLNHVVSFLASKRSDLVSGCAEEHRGSLHDRFIKALGEQHPDLLKVLQQEQEAAKKKAAATRKLTAPFKDQQSDTAHTSKMALGFNFQSSGTPAEHTQQQNGGEGGAGDSPSGDAVGTQAKKRAQDGRTGVLQEGHAAKLSALEGTGTLKPAASAFKFGFSL